MVKATRLTKQLISTALAAALCLVCCSCQPAASGPVSPTPPIAAAGGGGRDGTHDPILTSADPGTAIVFDADPNANSLVPGKPPVPFTKMLGLNGHNYTIKFADPHPDGKTVHAKLVEYRDDDKFHDSDGTGLFDTVYAHGSNTAIVNRKQDFTSAATNTLTFYVGDGSSTSSTPPNKHSSLLLLVLTYSSGERYILGGSTHYLTYRAD